MNIDRKTEQSEVRNFEEIDQVLEIQNKKKHGLLVKKDNKQNISFRKEKEIYEECKERQGANNNRILKLKRRSMWKAKTVNKQARYPGCKEKVQGFRKEYALKNKEKLTRKGKKKENQYTYLGSKKTEGGFASAKSLEAIISSLM
ncbi:44273_t:CDS:2, partial [Gigaspora margarita]